jgi:phosphotransferase system  glucose/maltose/N-acetylglucosamine-specific IIC component
MELKKIGILSAGKILGLLAVIYGFILGILVDVVYGKTGCEGLTSVGLGQLCIFGYASIILLPILWGIMYFIVGIIFAFLYNMIARRVGGIQLELEETEKKKAKEKKE